MYEEGKKNLPLPARNYYIVIIFRYPPYAAYFVPFPVGNF